MTAIDYTDVTEARGNQITREALDMMFTRYAFAARYCEGREVLEVACGAGQGLGLLQRRAGRAVGVDYTLGLLAMARAQYGSRVPLAQVDAHALPFRVASFDVVVLYEALYYLADPLVFLREARRVLRPGGHLLVCTVNREWPDFNPSPFSTRYHSADELRGLLSSAGFGVAMFAGFPVAASTGRDRAVSRLKRAAVALRLMPKTMAGKRLLKRLFLGRLVDFPAELRDGAATYREPAALPPGHASGHKVLYAVGAA